MSEILQGDCLEVMKQFPDNHFTGIVTDSPFGISFMGKGWDKGIPGIEYWQEMLRITKPGGLIIAAGLPRMMHRLVSVIEDAGWEIRDLLMHLFGSGFPKSHNHFGFEGYGTALKPAWEGWSLAMKPLEGTFKQNYEKWGVGGINIDACRVATDDKISRVSSKTSIWGSGDSKQVVSDGNKKGERWPANLLLDEEAAAMLDEQSGVLKSGSGDKHSKTQKGKTFSGLNPISGLRKYDSDSGGASRFFFIARKDKSDIIDSCKLIDESLLVGKKTENEDSNQSTVSFGNKPTGLFQPDTISIIEMETHSTMTFPILNASKQTLIGTCTLECEKSIKQSMALNIESVNIAKNGECSIHFQNAETEPIKAIVKNVPQNAWLIGEEITENIGTNIIENDGKGRKTNTTKNISIRTERKSTREDARDMQIKSIPRFFYCAKTSSKERNEGLGGLPDKMMDVDREGRNQAGFNSDDRPPMLPRKNYHPTVKPLALMRYLITLISPPSNALILDPFAGSGSTIIAAEQLHIKAIGIEKQADYCEIARARLKYAAEKVHNVAEQMELF